MHSLESTTHSYCEWHTKYGGGMSVCCECYPDKCEQNREVKEEDLKKGFMTQTTHDTPIPESVEEIIELTERIVILYANYSGRESDNRATFRNEVEKIVSQSYTQGRASMRSDILAVVKNAEKILRI